MFQHWPFCWCPSVLRGRFGDTAVVVGGGATDGAWNPYRSSVGLCAGVAMKFRTVLLDLLLCGASVLALGFEAARKCFLGL